ncbi:MAG: MCE family protein [Planctomycetes bacterium]|nr:MCE family protein [Planctomycetota bacterium]
MPRGIDQGRVNKAVGALVIVAALAAMTFFVIASRTQRWFVPLSRLTLALPEDGSYGLRVGGDIEIMGTRVGEVEAVRVSEEGRMEARIAIRSDFARFLASDSVAIIKKRFGVGGDSYVEISRGSGAPLTDKSPPLSTTADRSPTDMLQEMIGEIRQEAVPTLKEIHLAVTEYRQLAVDLRNKDGSLQQLIAHLNNISASVDQGEGIVGRLLKDRALADKLTHSVDQLSAAIDKTQKIIDDAGKSTDKLPEAVVQINAILADLRTFVADMKTTGQKLPELTQGLSDSVQTMPGLVLQAQQTLHEAERLIDAIQNHWLFRDYVAPDTAPQRLPPIDSPR